jgi:starch phosphorylase
MDLKITPSEFRLMIDEKLARNFGKTVQGADGALIFRACAQIVMEMMEYRVAEKDKVPESGKQVHYLSMEFLPGRSLMKNAYNLGILDSLTEALSGLGLSASEVFEAEADAGLGGGGLGRLAACYMDSMTTLGLSASGYSICYEFGLFKQRIVDGRQTELPDDWMESGGVWLIPRPEETEPVRFGGQIEEQWHDGRLHIKHTGYTEVLAVPMDMPISGYRTDHVNTLRLWSAKSPVAVDMDAFSAGRYLKAVEQDAMAHVITSSLYPDDSHYEGKVLRLKQQYFFVSATLKSIVRKHRSLWGGLSGFHEKNVLHINDTHPALVIPELMRLLMDEEGYGWDEAWDIVTRSVAYTNHTVMQEALEHWPQELICTLLPRIWYILKQINDRYLAALRSSFPGNCEIPASMAVIWGNEVRMANLCVHACFKVNGVSKLHTDILRNDVFKYACLLNPDKFINVTNGIDHRRWLAQINPGLHGLLCELIGDGYLTQPEKLGDPIRYAEDASVLQRLHEIKQENKRRLSDYVLRETGVPIDPDSIFDVQVKRLHEYKRQLLNLLHILSLYRRLRENPRLDIPPRTFIFGAKAAPGYLAAKRIIQLIHSAAREINGDRSVREKLRVVFLENYRVSLAERIIPASNISEQISAAGKEASGTGNMKFMLNGALTVGTLDGANVEISELVGRENIFIFGLTADEAARLRSLNAYSPISYYSRNSDLKYALDRLSGGFSDGNAYRDLVSPLLGGQTPDPYFLLGDFDSYTQTQQAAGKAWLDRDTWNKSCLMNIARAGSFAADRSVREYAEKIWR